VCDKIHPTAAYQKKTKNLFVDCATFVYYNNERRIDCQGSKIEEGVITWS